MRLVILSDTHGRHRRIDVPAGDALVHAGDFSPWIGTLKELSDFNDFLGGLPHRHKIVIAGNHDFCFQRANRVARAVLTNAHYLEDESFEAWGLKFYGSPWQPRFLNLAFNLPRGEPLREKWALIPPDTDVLVTHGPPHGIGDQRFYGHHVGCEELLIRVRHIKPRVHIFGHVHEARGRFDIGDTIFINASSDCNGREPFVLEL
ncbi:MAG: metallophosphatase domain-containing protein [Candidatus Krumholzibacteria bacterium]|nr:metallophosphatase domain-containing protein [Candidatus Krumholzibacteria bacterium]